MTFGDTLTVPEPTATPDPRVVPADPLTVPPPEATPMPRVLPEPAAAPAKTGLPLTVSYKDGLTFSDADKNLELKLNASGQFDARSYYLDDSVAPASFDMRRGRLSLSAKLYGFATLQVMGAFEDQPHLRSATCDLKFHEALRLTVGQMKVPFSTQWLTSDTNVDFLEYAGAEPIYTSIDRGVQVWGDLFGKRITYTLGAFNGTGLDIDTNKGDIDNYKDVAGRLFLQPFKGLEINALEGLYLVGQGTYGRQSVPTRRYETRGLASADFASQVWRWRTEQTLGTDGRNTDQIAARVDARSRWGAELHYLNGPFNLAVEWLHVRYEDIGIYHQYYSGAKRLKNDLVLMQDGDIDSITGTLSLFLTGEGKTLDNNGYKQPAPKAPFIGGDGMGAIELLGRFTMTRTADDLFNTTKVTGYVAEDFGTKPPTIVGEGNSVTAAVLDGAPKLYEASLGLNWTLSTNVRAMFTGTYLLAANYKTDDNGVAANGLLSGGSSDLAYPLKKNRQIERELLVGARLIFKI